MDVMGMAADVQNHAYAWATSQLQNNDFLVGFLVTGIASVGLFIARNMPRRIYNWCVSFFTVRVTITSDENMYGVMQRFALNRIVFKRLQRSFVIGVSGTGFRGNGEDEDSRVSVGYGRHYGWYRGRFVSVTREQVQSDSHSFKEMLTLRILGRSRAFVETLADDAIAYNTHEKSARGMEIRVRSGSFNDIDLEQVPYRTWDTIFLPARIKSEIIDHLDWFAGAEQWHAARGMSWHTGILLHGAPGGGKSSIVKAIASHLRRDMVYINLGDISTDTSLVRVFSTANHTNSIVVIEDIDAAGQALDREETKAQKVSLSSMLNVLDGILTPHGMIIVATTNSIESLDNALLRPGRFDLCLEIPLVAYDEYVEMARAFGVDPGVREAYEPVSGAEARRRLIGR